MLNTCISKNMNRILFYIFLGGMLMISGCRDQISISDKKDIINIETCPIESSRIKSSISLSQSEEYGFLNFTTRFFETEDYIRDRYRTASWRKYTRRMVCVRWNRVLH